MACDLRIEGELTVVGAAQQRELWLGWLTETAGADFADWPAVTLDLQAVEAFDSAGVQLLLALQHSLQRRGQQLLLADPAACVQDALKRFGLEARLATAPATAVPEGEEALS